MQSTIAAFFENAAMVYVFCGRKKTKKVEISTNILDC